jgi:CDP-diacylglycerol--serine O-phosphatidyltransferase
MIRKNIPNFFTLCNLLCGCVGIVFALNGHFNGDFAFASILIFIAAIFDFADGFAARILKSSSEIGKQLDSLADMISFGVLPGMIMFRFFLENHTNTYLLFIPFLIPIFSAIRLAKFNMDERQTNSFIGLPTPANAVFISSFPFIVEQYNLIQENSKDIFSKPGLETFHSLLFNMPFLISVALISSFLLVAPLPLFALKFKNFSWADNKVRYLFLILSLALLILFQFVGIPLIILLYIVLSVINNVVTKKSVDQL